MSIHPTQLIKAINGARAYALSDKSDPFAFNRAMTHTLNGVCNRRFTKSGEPIECNYHADCHMETRHAPSGYVFQDGSRKFLHQTYRNGIRP